MKHSDNPTSIGGIHIISITFHQHLKLVTNINRL